MAAEQIPGESTLSEEELIDDAEVDTLVREAIAQVIGDSQFLHSKTNQWSSNIVERYVVSCALTQKAGAGLHTASSCRWAEATDGKLALQWENQSILALVTVYWLAI